MDSSSPERPTGPVDIVGLGSVAMDVMVQVDALPGPDGFAVVTGTEFLPGGSGTNVITQAARLGARCAYIAKVGDDALGTDILANLRTEGIDDRAMQVVPGGTSLHTTVVVDRTGSRFILLNMGDAFAALQPDEVDTELVRRARVFYTDLLPGSPARAGLEVARAAGARTAFNLQVGMGTMTGLGVSTDDVLAAAEVVDVFAPCRQGLADLAGTDDVHAGLEFARRHCQGTVVLTMGADGVVAAERDGAPVHVAAVPVEAVDTTGAGDSFMGAYLVSHLLEGRDLRTSLTRASACAALTCTRLGARSGPDRAQLDQFLTSRPAAPTAPIKPTKE